MILRSRCTIVMSFFDIAPDFDFLTQLTIQKINCLFQIETLKNHYILFPMHDCILQ